MPKLPEYTAPLGEVSGSGGRRASAEDFGTNYDGLGKAVGKAIDDVGDAESRKALIESTEIRAQYAKRLDEAAVNGEDLGKIKEAMNNDLSKVGDQFFTSKGRQDLRLHTASTNMMFDQQANSVEVHRAALDAKIQGGKFLNSTAALINQNPLYLKIAEGDAEAFASTLNRISPEKRTEIADTLKNQLNATAAIASARLDPQGTKTRLEAGDWDLTPDQREQATNEAEKQIRSLRADEAYKRELRDHDRRELNTVAYGEYYKGILAGTTTATAMANDARLQPETLEHLVGVMATRTRELRYGQTLSDPIVERDLWMRIHNNKSDPSHVYTSNAILAAVAVGSLNTTDGDKLLSQVADQKDENDKTIGSRLSGMMQIVEKAVSSDPRYLYQPALVAGIQMDYQARVFAKVAELRKAGQNPDDVFNPNSKEYVGSPKFIQGSVDNVTARAKGVGTVDIRVTPNAEIAVGDSYVSAKGETLIMTQAGFDARKQEAATTDEKRKAPNVFRSDAEKEVDRLYGTKSTARGEDRSGADWKRSDGSQKGDGFLGLLKRPDGKVSSEISIGVNIDGKQMEIPSLVPSLTEKEIDHLLDGKKPTDEIVDKAVAHAKQRLAQGKSVFAQPGEAPEVKAGKPQDSTKPMPLTEAAGAAASAGEAFLKNNKRAGDTPKKLSDEETSKVLKEIKHFKSIASDGKKSEAERNNAIKETIIRMLRMGMARDVIEGVIRAPLSRYGL